MRLYQGVCDDCGATSRVYTRRDKALAGHRCDAVCAECGWSRPYAARGLCGACYRSDVRYDHEAKQWRADDLLGEWDLLRREGFTVRQAADRLGVTFAALDKALCRAKRAGDPRAVRSAA